MNFSHYRYRLPYTGLYPAQGPHGKRPELESQLTSKAASSKKTTIPGFLPPAWAQTSLTRVPSDSGHFPRTWRPVSLHNQHHTLYSAQSHTQNTCILSTVNLQQVAPASLLVEFQLHIKWDTSIVTEVCIGHPHPKSWWPKKKRIIRNAEIWVVMSDCSLPANVMGICWL